MLKSNVTLSQAITQVDRSPTNPRAEGYRSQRAEILKRFPRDKWSEMRLEDYALGQPAVEDTYCRWLEYKSQSMGSMKGGAAGKLIIYKRKKGEGWHFPKAFSNEKEAWDRLRSEFVQAFELAERGEWERIDELETLGPGPAVKLKSLHVYFPDEVLPVYSTAHLRHFLRSLGRPSEEVNAPVVALNRFLLAALRREPGLEGWNTEELQRLLYNWRDPRETRRVLKIEPGKDARFWEDCLREGYICVGWDEVGDLSQFESKEVFRARFEEAYPYKGPVQARRKGNQLWTLNELEPGDRVVANRGIGRVLALGEVVEPGYRWADERPEYQHTVAVKWDTTYEQSVVPQKRWATVTVAKVPDALLRAIVGGKEREPIVVDPLYGRLATALERKGQLILYGPPGTGKTYRARRFAVWWLLRQIGHEGADAVLGDSDRLREAERELSTSQVSSRVWWVVANAKEWSWDQLFRDGKVDYRYGRLKRNYPLVQRGDLVIGYQSAPDRRIVALARVSRELQSVGDNSPTIGLEPVEQLDRGLSYDELTQDAVLAQSEPIRFNNQGTLFALTETEAEHLFVQLAERHPQCAILKQAGDWGTTASVDPLTRVTFHPSYTYEDFIEGFRPNSDGAGGLSLALEDGVFKRVCRAAQANPGRPYLLLIDEINRGNVAKIMGELLTLLERDKRGLTLTLPQSKETFSVPRNVFLLGTMNTADRSIKLLDAALRRRFAFLECMPDSELLHGAVVGDLALDDFLDGLNQRIARFEGREKQVGHSYLLVDGQPVDEVEEFAARFREEILPLLQEYCYDEYATLAKFIGSELVDANAGALDAEKLDDAEQLIAALAREFGEGGVSSA